MKDETKFSSDEFCKKVVGKSLDELTDEVMTIRQEISGPPSETSGLTPNEHRAFTKLICAYTVAGLAMCGMGLKLGAVPDSPDMPKAEIAYFDFEYKDGK